MKPGGVTGLYLNLFGHFSAGVDPVAFKFSEDGIEAAARSAE
jgi:hypothetical protein